MSYLVLARRWRPQKFSDLVGQDVVVRTLKNALASGNLAHAYLLCGIRGVGKTTIARLMAMAVNCEAPVEGEPCGSCTACQGIANGSNLDVQEMDAASHTGVDDVREILDGVRYPPSTLKFKIYIIDEAHMLSKSAFNALLKTLEEPPARVLFILATTESDKLPITVRSRCQRFDLRRLGQGEIAAYLEHVFASENITADSDAVAAIAAAADGSVRDALSLAERVLAYSSDKLSITDVQSALGLVGSELVRRLSQALFAGDAAASIEVLRAAVGRGHAPRALLLELSRLWHQLSCLKVDACLVGEEVDGDSRDWLEAHADLLSLKALDLRYQVLLSGIRDLAIVDERMGSEMVLMRLCGLNTISPIDRVTVEPLPAIEEPGKNRSPAPARQRATMMFEAVPEPEDVQLQDQSDELQSDEVAAAAEPDLPIENQPPGRDFGDWQQVVEAFGKVKPGVSAMLEHVICVEFGKKVRLALDKHQERAIATADRLAFAEWLGREVFWESQKDHQGESLSQERDRQARNEIARLRKAAQDDPHVQALMREMDAQLVRVLPAGVQPDETP
ncbi:DNA polymerase-3 subunit gamma/tau [Mariprofundus ferrinatatus]|uniref:DNA polymerase III subunit gamma/tau n=1 Tax=Mariprofundus ferrinatatus TaxID=1921087 RepID=A0A2K8L2M5_9PROT|nr:DNA polymerase III subunit gamma/tau [Mariprofundus ferrinatatus]ATX81547.1 DNA polymerase-3 subunit gamma/tau [Mariprofundus ferrinatatus]